MDYCRPSFTLNEQRIDMKLGNPNNMSFGPPSV